MRRIPVSGSKDPSQGVLKNIFEALAKVRETWLRVNLNCPLP